MQHLFYLAAIPFLIYEMRWVFFPKQRIESAQKRIALSHEIKGKKWDDFTEQQKKDVFSFFLLASYFIIWQVLGLFTFQWPLFVANFVIALLIARPISKLLEKNKLAFGVLYWLYSIISLVFTVFVIVNKYHLHINVWEVVKSWF